MTNAVHIVYTYIHVDTLKPSDTSVTECHRDKSARILQLTYQQQKRLAIMASSQDIYTWAITKNISYLHRSSYELTVFIYVGFIHVLKTCKRSNLQAGYCTMRTVYAISFAFNILFVRYVYLLMFEKLSKLFETHSEWMKGESSKMWQHFFYFNIK